MRRQAGEPDSDPSEIGERALRAHQQLRQIHRAIACVRAYALRGEDVEVVATHTPQNARKHARDLVALARTDRLQAIDQLARATVARHALDRPEGDFAAVGEDRVDAEYVVDHVSVLDRARSTGVVARHA